MGSARIATSPASTMTIESTPAKIGRSIKNLEITGALLRDRPRAGRLLALRRWRSSWQEAAEAGRLRASPERSIRFGPPPLAGPGRPNPSDALGWRLGRAARCRSERWRWARV